MSNEKLQSDKLRKKFENLLKIAKDDALYTAGMLKACQEASDGHKKAMLDLREQLTNDVKEGKMNNEAANYFLQLAGKLTQSIQALITDKTQLYYAKIGSSNTVDVCLKMVAEHEEASVKLDAKTEKIPAEVVVVEENKKESPVLEAKSKSTTKEKRPDDPETKLGKKLQDIRKRKKSQ